MFSLKKQNIITNALEKLLNIPSTLILYLRISFKEPPQTCFYLMKLLEEKTCVRICFSCLTARGFNKCFKYLKTKYSDHPRISASGFFCRYKKSYPAFFRKEPLPS